MTQKSTIKQRHELNQQQCQLLVAEDQASLTELRKEAEACRERTATDAKLLRTLSNTPGSPTATRCTAQVRDRYEQNLERNCDLLWAIVEDYEAKITQLDENHVKLFEKHERLRQKFRRTQYQLQRALGVRSKSKEAAATAEKPTEAATSNNENKSKTTGKRGAPRGHRGNTRAIPQHIDREEIVEPPSVCKCGCQSIIPLTEFDAKYIEDIPPVSKITTRLTYLHGRCADCGATVHHPQAMSGPPVRIGPNLAAHLTIMNYMGMTFRKLSAFTTNTLGVKLTPAGVLGVIQRTGDAIFGCYQDIGESIRHQPWLNGDETGWKIMGKSCYIWCFCNHHLAYFHPDHSRGAKVIEAILGNDFKGIVICDFYAAYNCVDKTQRCLVHLLRDIAKEREVLSKSKLLEQFENAVRRFIQEGLKAQAMPEGPVKQQAVAKVQKQLERLSNMKVTKGKATVLLKRIRKYRDDLIRFVCHPGVEFHNNRAERQIRPLVIARKISFGSNTDHGALRYCIIHSVLETCRMQDLDPVPFLRRAYSTGGLDLPEITAKSPPAA